MNKHLGRIPLSLKQILAVIVFLLAVGLIFNLGARWGARGGGPQRGGAGRAGEATGAPSAAQKELWLCAMDPQIIQSGPGQCPICGMDLVPVPTSGGDSTDGEGSPRRFRMSAEARAIAQVETVPVERRWVENEVRMVGLVDYDERRLAYLTAYVGGRLDRLYVDFTGTQVRQGDHMVYLYSPDLRSTQKELLEAKELVETGSEALRRIARGNLEGARDRLRLWGLTAEQIDAIEKGGTYEDHLTIYAPLGGIVIEKHVRQGDYVKTGDLIYSIADLTHLWIKLNVYESDLEWLRYGQDVVFTTEAYPGREFHGRISFIDPTLDPMTRTVNVRVNVENADSVLKPGMFVRAVARSRVAGGGKVIDPDLAGKWISPMHPEIIKDHPGTCDVCGMDLVPVEEWGYVAAVEEEPPLIIPASAPLRTGKRAVVYVQLPGEEDPTYEGREIVLGPRVGDYYIVLDGLREEEQVVTNGAFRIDSSLQIMARPSMMSPDGGQLPTGHARHGGDPQAMEPREKSPPTTQPTTRPATTQPSRPPSAENHPNHDHDAHD